MAYSTLPIAGINLATTVPIEFAYTEGTTAISIPNMGPLGTQTFGSDGKRYVLAQAGAAITASTATCSVNASTFVATGSAGSYLSPAVALASGDYAWFAATSV
jgi:hypothetical protein